MWFSNLLPEHGEMVSGMNVCLFVCNHTSTQSSSLVHPTPVIPHKDTALQDFKGPSLNSYLQYPWQITKLAVNLDPFNWVLQALRPH